MAKGKEKKLPPFPSSHHPPRAFYFSIIAIFIGIPNGNHCEGKSLYLSSKALKGASDWYYKQNEIDIHDKAPYIEK